MRMRCAIASAEESVTSVSLHVHMKVIAIRLKYMDSRLCASHLYFKVAVVEDRGEAPRKKIA